MITMMVWEISSLATEVVACIGSVMGETAILCCSVVYWKHSVCYLIILKHFNNYKYNIKMRNIRR